MDFMHDALVDGRRFRTPNALDPATRECLAIELDTPLPGPRRHSTEQSLHPIGRCVLRQLRQLADRLGLQEATDLRTYMPIAVAIRCGQTSHRSVRRK
jgi:hypothetical protein